MLKKIHQELHLNSFFFMQLTPLQVQAVHNKQDEEMQRCEDETNLVQIWIV